MLGAVAAGLIPGVGHVISAGLLVGVVGGLAAGAVTGGLVGVLVGEGIPETEARYYEKEVESGRTRIMVKAGDRYEAAITILRRKGAYGQGRPLI